MTRLLAITAAIGALALAGCEAEEEATGTLTTDEVATQMDSLAKPRPGLYSNNVEFTTFEIPGLPEGQVEQMRGMVEGQIDTVGQFCLTEEESSGGIEDAVRRIGEGSAGLDCNFERFDADGNTFDAAMQCKGGFGGEIAMTMKGEIEQERQVTAMTIQQTAGGANITIGMDVTAERVGDCPA